MRWLAWICLLWPAVLLANDRAAQLESIKADFPQHISGPISARSDPHAKEIYDRYLKEVQAITLETLAEDIVALRDQVKSDITITESTLRRKTQTNDASGRHAMRQNVVWLKQKMIPYLNRLSQFQRGR